MKNKLLLSFALLVLSFSSLFCGYRCWKNLAARCSACHGVAGISANPQLPNLAGQKGFYLVS